MAKQNLGMVTAYAYAVAGGYTGTEAEFEALLGNIATDLEEIENLTVTATTLPEGSSATASYSDGVLTLGIPKGDTGATGAGATATAGTTTTGEPGTDASVVNSGTTKDAVFDFTIPRGDTGNGIESITLTSTVGAVHTYTITFTDGDTTTFEVTDGEVTNNSLYGILTDYITKENASLIMERVISPNRFNMHGDIKEGYYLGSNGSLVANASWCVSDYCYVGDLAQIYGTADNASGRKLIYLYYLCTYDANKNFIAQVDAMPASPVAITGSVKYVRFCFHVGDETGQLQCANLTAQQQYYGFYDYYNVKKSVEKTYSDSINFTPEALTLTPNRVLSGLNGHVFEGSGNAYKVSDPVAVTPNGKIMVTTSMAWGQGLYAFYDSNDECIIIRRCKYTTGTDEKIYNEIIDVPINAATIRVAIASPTNSPYLWTGVPQVTYHTGIWKDKKWTCIGDSLTEYNTRTSMHYFDFIRADTGISFVNMGISGTGYAKGDSNNFVNRIANVPTDSDVVTIFGSGNDGSAGLPLGTATDSGTTTLGGCINTTIDNLYTIMPIVQLGIVTPTPWVGNMPSDNGWMESYANLIVEICKRRSIPCLDLYHCSNLNPNDATVRSLAYDKDEGNGVHPSELGHKIIAPRFKAFLESLII